MSVLFWVDSLLLPLKLKAKLLVLTNRLADFEEEPGTNRKVNQCKKVMSRGGEHLWEVAYHI